MTREQLDAIRARARSIEANKPRNDVWLFVRQDVPALLAEVEGMRESCTGLVKQNERQYDEVLRLTTEVERLRAELDTVGEVLAATSLKCDYAFARGVAAMREAAIEWAWRNFVLGAMASVVVRDLRALPDPEDKS